MTTAEKSSYSYKDWENCAYIWLDVFKVDEETVRCIKEAENYKSEFKRIYDSIKPESKKRFLVF